jgi:hypothetical protein
MELATFLHLLLLLLKTRRFLIRTLEPRVQFATQLYPLRPCQTDQSQGLKLIIHRYTDKQTDFPYVVIAQPKGCAIENDICLENQMICIFDILTNALDAPVHPHRVRVESVFSQWFSLYQTENDQ